MRGVFKPLLAAASAAWSVCASAADTSGLDLPKDINIDLKAEWDAVPFQLELVEAIASENSTIYHPLLLELSTNEQIEDTANPSDKLLYDTAIKFALDNGYISESAVPFIDLALGLHKHSAKIQAFYQYHDSVASSPSSEKCPVWISYNKKTSCDSDTVFALETKSNGISDNSLILPHDRVFGSRRDAPVAILYADITHKSFPVFHKHLYHSAENGKIRYILRYRKSVFDENDPQTSAPEKQPLAGYGVELYVKRTDYLVIDDRDVKTENNENEDTTSNDHESKKIELKAADEGATIKKQNIPLIGVKAVGFIMNNENKFDSLVNVSLDFPRYSHSISELPVDRDLKLELAKTRITPGANIIYINGAPVTQPNDDIFTITNAIQRERGFFSLFNELGIKSEDAIKLITFADSPEQDILKSNDNFEKKNDAEKEEDDEEEEEDGDEEEKEYSKLKDSEYTRFDYRSSSLLWINDIVKDSQYRRWSPSISQFRNTGQSHFLPIRHNAHTLIYAFDPSNEHHMRSLYDIMLIWQRNVPIQVALLPLPHDRLGEQITYEMYAIYENGKNRRGLTQYLSKLLSGVNHITAANSFYNTKKYESYRSIFDDKKIATALEEAKATARRLDIQVFDTHLPTIIVNGVFITPDPNWFYEMSQIVKSDSFIIKGLIEEGEIDDDDSDIVLKDILLQESFTRRNRIISSDASNIVYNSVDELYDTLWPNHQQNSLSDNVASFVRERIAENTEDPDFVSTYWIFGKSHTKSFLNQVIQGLTFLSQSKDTFRLNVVPIIDPQASRSKQQTANIVNTILYLLTSQKADLAYSKEAIENIYTALYGTYSEKRESPSLEEIKNKITPEDSFSTTQTHYDLTYHLISQLKTPEYKNIVNSDLTIVSAGRVITLPDGVFLEHEDLGLLQEYEFKTRIKGLINISKILNLFDSIKASSKETGNYRHVSFAFVDKLVSLVSKVKFNYVAKSSIYNVQYTRLDVEHWNLPKTSFEVGNKETALIHLTAVIDPLSEKGQVYISYLQSLSQIPNISIKVILNPKAKIDSIPLKRFYRASLPIAPKFDSDGAIIKTSGDVVLSNMPQSTLLYIDLDVPPAWIVMPKKSIYDLDNIILDKVEPEGDGNTALKGTYELKHVLIEGHASDVTRMEAPRGVALNLSPLDGPFFTDTIIMENLGYLQLKATPGLWQISLKEGPSAEIFEIESTALTDGSELANPDQIWVTEFTGITIIPRLRRKRGMEGKDVLEQDTETTSDEQETGDSMKKAFEDAGKKLARSFSGLFKKDTATQHKAQTALSAPKKNAEINIFSVASGHLYERFLSIMTYSVTAHTNHTVKFWIIENFLSPKFKDFLPYLAKERGFEYELVTYKWPHWLRHQTEKQRTIWGYKILFLDVLFPQSLDKIIFVDADQIVRTDMHDLVELDLHGAPYGFTPMCDSREEIEGFRFWKQGYWKRYLGELKYHISALYVVDLVRFRELAAGDMLRQHYQMLSADPGSLSNLDQDLPNHLQRQLPIFSLPQDWLWCETWCSDESLLTAKTIDLCNNPMTKEPKLDRARRQVPEWTKYDDQVAALDKKVTKYLQEAEAIQDVPDLIPDLGDSDDESDDDEEILKGAQKAKEEDHEIDYEAQLGEEENPHDEL